VETLKEKIITLIEQTDDDSLLGRIFEFLEKEIQEDNAVFSDKQMSSILKAKDQFVTGKVKTQKEIDNRFEKWMKE
jgi:predicted Zn-ribbon and HTH transcriptional regulator